VDTTNFLQKLRYCVFSCFPSANDAVLRFID
jgi:hypothetical protein